MSKGSEEKEHKFDQQCQYCDKWYRKRGIGSHERNCPQNDSIEDTTMPTEPENEPEPEPEEPEENDNEITDNIRCPTCGNEDNDVSPKIYYASDIVEHYREELAKQDIEMLSKKELFCMDCHNAFDSK
jgi:cytochrome c-type biogenesis protein CcmH/NrfF